MKSVSRDLPQYENRILAALPAGERDAIKRHLSSVELPLRMVLQQADQPTEYAFFLETGIASMVSTLRDGSTVEVGLIGRDGVVGLASVLGTERTPFDCFIQSPGHGYSITSKRLKEHFATCKKLQERLLCAAQGQMVQMGQIAVCNRLHDIQERLARWLLSCHDRTDSDELSLTHEFMATMLGAPRSTVTVAAGILQQAGLIEYSRGHVTIRDREGLEDSTCECYAIIRNETARLRLL